MTTPTVRSTSTQPTVAPRSAEAPAPASQARETAQPAAPAAARDQFSTQPAASTGGERLSGERRSGEHTPLPSIAIGEEIPTRRPRVMELSEPAAKEAIATVESGVRTQLGQAIASDGGATSFKARSVETDELGMTHVRLDRMHNGVPVLGEQVIGHLDRNGDFSSVTGNLSAIPADLGKGQPALSADQAVQAALKEYGKGTDVPPKATRVLVQDETGQYRDAYRVETQNFQGASPERMNYLVDAQTGKVIGEPWNQIGGISEKDLQRAEQAAAARDAARADVPVSIQKSSEPNLPIGDHQTVTDQIQIDDQATIDNLKLNLDIPHTWKGDLEVKITSPSGKEHIVHNRTGGSQDNVTGQFDLSEVFKGEEAKGTWTISVSDKARLDQGTLKSWGLSIDGHKPGEPEPTPGNDNSLYAGTVEVGGTTNADGTQTMLDTTRGQGVETRDANNRSRPTGSTELKDNDGAWNQTGDSPRQTGAVDAQYGAQMTYDFYKNILGRDSIDGKGEKLKNNVHVGNNYVNAFWDGTQMSYGDGDGRRATHLTTLDIAGHEITHGLTERTAGLIYRNQSGGINESMSDIMGAGVDWYAKKQNPSINNDIWRVGEQAWTPGTEGDALRYMDDPSKDNYSIDHFSKYPQQTEVHGSSGIMNNAFYLLVNGGTNKTSGMQVGGLAGGEGGFDAAMEKGLKIYGRALTTYMTPNTTFAQARQATIQAATDLYGADSAEVAQVKASWSAVGVE
jgi:Zn-dependent metalloprotease